MEFRGVLKTEVGIPQRWKRTGWSKHGLQEARRQRVEIFWIWKLVFLGYRMVILGNEERLRDEDRGEEETRRGFGSETGG